MRTVGLAVSGTSSNLEASLILTLGGLEEPEAMGRESDSPQKPYASFESAGSQFGAADPFGTAQVQELETGCACPGRRTHSQGLGSAHSHASRPVALCVVGG